MGIMELLFHNRCPSLHQKPGTQKKEGEGGDAMSWGRASVVEDEVATVVGGWRRWHNVEDENAIVIGG